MVKNWLIRTFAFHRNEVFHLCDDLGGHEQAVHLGAQAHVLQDRSHTHLVLHDIDPLGIAAKMRVFSGPVPRVDGVIREIELFGVSQHFLPHFRVRHAEYLVDEAEGSGCNFCGFGARRINGIIKRQFWWGEKNARCPTCPCPCTAFETGSQRYSASTDTATGTCSSARVGGGKSATGVDFITVF